MIDTLVRLGFAVVALCVVAMVAFTWWIYGGLSGAYSEWLPVLSIMTAFAVAGVALIVFVVVYDFN